MRGSRVKSLRWRAKAFATESNEYIAPKIMVTSRYVVHQKDGTTVPFPYHGTIVMRKNCQRRIYKALKRWWKRGAPGGMDALHAVHKETK